MRDFDEHNPRIRIIFGLVTLLVVIGGVWLAAGFIWPEDNGQITILKADNTPYKVKPDQPGGMQIPHQDKLIFNTVSSDGKMVTVERILPGPEAPLNAQPATPEIPVAVPTAQPAADAPKPVDAKAADKPADKAVEKTDAKAAPLPTTAPKIDAPVAPPVAAMGRVIEATPEAAKPSAAQPAKPPAAFDMSKGEPQPVVKPAPVPEEEPAPIAAKEPTVKDPFVKESTVDEEPTIDTSGPKSKARVKDTAAKDPVDDTQDDNEPAPTKKETASTGKAHFQLASFFDKPSADKGLAQFKSKYASELQGASLSIATATINGGKQVFRVQGTASSAATASDICSDIKAKGGSCVTIRQ